MNNDVNYNSLFYKLNLNGRIVLSHQQHQRVVRTLERSLAFHLWDYQNPEK